MINKQDIFAVDDRPMQPVDVPEWGGGIFVRAMSGLERDTYEGGLLERRGLPMREKLKNTRAELVVLCVVDEDGNRLFSDEDIDPVSGKNAEVLTRIAMAASKLNKLDGASVDEETEN